MKVFKTVGSKDRLVEIFQKVNKVKLNEGLLEAGSPNLNAESVLNMAYNQLKAGKLDVENTNTETNGDESFIVLTCIDRQGNNITFTFKVSSSEGDQEGVYNVSNTVLSEFSFDSADGEDTIEMAEDGLTKFNQQYANELFDVIPKDANVGQSVESGVQEAIDIIDAIKPQSYPFGGSPKDMQTGSGYADQKPTNDSVRVKSPELDQFIQEDMTMPTKIRTIDELKAYREQLKAQGFKGLRKVDFPLLADQALHDMAIKLADRILPMRWDDLPDVNSMWDYIRKDGGMTFEQVLKAVKKAVNVRLKEEGYDLKSLGLGESAEHERYSEYYQDILKRLKAYAEKNGFDPIALKDDFMQEADPYNMKTPKDRIDKFFEIANEVLRSDEPQQSIQEIDKPAMKLIQQAPGGATAGGVKQLEERMKLPIVGGVGMGVSEVQMVGSPEPLGEPKPINPSTKSPVDDLPPEKRKVIMDAINTLTRFKPDFAPSADQINTEILRQRNLPVQEGNDVDDADVELKRFYKEKELASQHPEQLSAPEELPVEEPEMILSQKDIDMIYQAEANLMAKNARNRNYSPTTDEIRVEMDNIKGIKKPLKKFRSVSKEAEPYMNEGIHIDINKIVEKYKNSMRPENKEALIKGVQMEVDDQLGIFKSMLPEEMYKEMIRRSANAVYAMDLSKQNEGEMLSEDAEKSDYPDPLGKKFKPKKHYPHKKKKLDTTVKLTEDVYGDDDIETPDLPVDTAARRAMGAEKQARSDIRTQSPLNVSYDQTEFQPELAEDEAKTGEKELEDGYHELMTRDTFQKLSDAYSALLNLSNEFRSDPKIQETLSDLRDVIAQYCQMSDMHNVTPEDVQNFFENTLQESLYEDGEEKPEGGMSLEPESDEIEQLAQDKEEQGEILQGGLGDGKSPLEFSPDQILAGLMVEKEHSDNPLAAIEIVMDHLSEDPEYYTQKDTPETSAQAGASAEAGGGDDKEMTDRLLGYKPHNVGDEVEEPVDEETTSVSDMGSRFQSIANTPRPETPMVQEDAEKDLKDRDPASWHQIQIAKKTLKMPGAMAGVMGGMSKEEAKQILTKRGIKFDEK